MKKNTFAFYAGVLGLTLVCSSFFNYRAAAKLNYQLINQVVALVGDIAITQSDLEENIGLFKIKKNIKKDKRDIESQTLDHLISQAIVDYAAKEESLKISENQIDQEINRQMAAQGITDIEKFKALIKKELKLTWQQYREETKNQLLVRQIMQIRVPVTPPDEQEIRQWYNKNKRKLGKKYLARIIQMRFKGGNYQDELRVSKSMKAARTLALNDFVTAAKKYSQHASASQGGSIGWVRPEEIALQDPFLAGAIANSPNGKVSQVFVGQGAYYIVKVEKSAPIQYDEVHNYITAFLYNQKEQDAFAHWLQEERKRLSIQIFAEGYTPPK